MKKRATLVLLIIMFYLPLRLIAQPDFGDGGDDVNDVPFDGGVSVLIAAGIAYGLKQTYDLQRQKNYKK